MPAKLVSPIEIVKKEAVLIDQFETTKIFINLEGDSYVRIEYQARDADGNIVGNSELTLDAAETAQFIADNPAFYNSIKRESYDLAKAHGIIPSDAGVI